MGSSFGLAYTFVLALKSYAIAVGKQIIGKGNRYSQGMAAPNANDTSRSINNTGYTVINS
jgi:hypothetical protein